MKPSSRKRQASNLEKQSPNTSLRQLCLKDQLLLAEEVSLLSSLTIILKRAMQEYLTIRKEGRPQLRKGLTVASTKLPQVEILLPATLLRRNPKELSQEQASRISRTRTFLL
jgi:hypothetical protein